MSTATIAENKVVSMNYTLKDKDGNVLDASQGEPLQYLQGHQNIIPGLERELAGLKAGDKKQVQVQPQDGYGDYNAELRMSISTEQFAPGEKPEVGMMVQFDSPQGPLMARIVSLEDNQVQLDMNHPLAGEVLFFDVEITEVRDASQEELQHGHPHGPGGHHH